VILRYLSEGVSGYILESSSQSEIEGAIGALIARSIYIAPSVMANADQPKQEVLATPLKPRALTRRQLAVLTLLLNSYSNKDIARELGVSHHTVKIHVGALLRYFSAKNRVELTITASHSNNSLYNDAHKLSTLAPSADHVPSLGSSGSVQYWRDRKQSKQFEMI